MSIDLILPFSLASGLVLWALIFRWYVDPIAQRVNLVDVLQPILLLHSFRFIGLMFLIDGVTSAPLDPRFAEPAAYGDLIAAILAFAALLAIRRTDGRALWMVWIFNLWGLGDLLNAVARGLQFTPDGALGAAFWIPATIVPLLLVTHGYVFVLLRRAHPDSRRAAA